MSARSLRAEAKVDLDEAVEGRSDGEGALLASGGEGVRATDICSSRKGVKGLCMRGFKNVGGVVGLGIKRVGPQ